MAGLLGRDVNRKFKSIEPTGAEKRVAVLMARIPGTRPGICTRRLDLRFPRDGGSALM
jgi:hypothetical protein